MNEIKRCGGGERRRRSGVGRCDEKSVERRKILKKEKD
jgi:hypothetical protein